MNIRTGLGVAALVLSVLAWFAGGAAAWIAMAAMLVATIAVTMNERLFALTAVVVVVAKVFFAEPAIWTMVAGEGPASRSRTVDAWRIFLLGFMTAPFVAIAINTIQSRLTNRLIALFGFGVFAGFLGMIGWGVPQLALLTVFGIAIAMAAYDFWRELSKGNGDSPD